MTDSAARPSGHTRRSDLSGHTRHPVLLDAEDDRWAWRRRIRQDPRKAFFYRIGVGILGGLLVIAGPLTGPLPGPGGIPLVLLGLAVWSSEFEWAQRLMLRFKALVRRYLAWPRRTRVLFWVAFIAVCWLCGYLMMTVTGIPTWVPEWLAVQLDKLPRVHRH